MHLLPVRLGCYGCDRIEVVAPLADKNVSFFFSLNVLETEMLE